MRYSIDQISALIGAKRYGQCQEQIEWLLTDSRSLCFPESSLFFALTTQRNDGHRYIDDLYRRGVRAFVVHQLPDDWSTRYPDACFLWVKSVLTALQRLAERHRETFNIPVVGITGSNGKTVVKEWLYHVLSPEKKVTRSPRSYNSQIGVPLSVMLITPQTEIAVFEAGISMTGEMDTLTAIIQPTIGVFTALGSPHQENFTSLAQKADEKMKLFADTKQLVFPADDKEIVAAIDRARYIGKRLGWSMHDQQADYYISEVRKTGTQTVIAINHQQQTCTITIPFIDDASVMNAITTAVTTMALGVEQQTIVQKMAELEPVAMRLQVMEGIQGCTIINDSYNNDIHSLDIALDFMQRRHDTAGRKRTLILSDILQSNQTDDVLYAEVDRLARSRQVERLIGVGPQISAARTKFSIPHCAFFNDTEELMRSGILATLHDEMILIKGARQFSFDRIAERLMQKVHETILEVNLNAVVDNLNYYRSMLKPDTRITCMIKADGYGAGAVEIAKTLQDQGVDYLAVAVADEGVTLRRHGITANIMVMNPEMSSFKTLFDYELEPEVYCFRLLDALIHAAEREDITHFPVHVKLDTGMHRLGFDPLKDMEALIQRFSHQDALMPRSVFSHFVGADSDEFDRFSAMQFERFLKGSDTLQQAFQHHIIRHICNSAGIPHFPERQLDMCRLGLGLYGIDSRDNHILNNVCTLKTTILQLRHVPKEETVGYSRKGVLTRDSVIAALPIGYADGLNRHLGRGHGFCLVNGQKAPYVGNICMDVAMVDVTDIPCQEGDQVEIFGDNLPVTTLSDILDTIPYEVLTSVSNRVKKVYFKD